MIRYRTVGPVLLVVLIGLPESLRRSGIIFFRSAIYRRGHELQVDSQPDDYEKLSATKELLIRKPVAFEDEPRPIFRTCSQFVEWHGSEGATPY